MFGERDNYDRSALPLATEGTQEMTANKSTRVPPTKVRHY